MSAKPVESIERMRNDWRGSSMSSCEKDCKTIIAYLDSIPADAVPVVWPADLTRERLEGIANAMGNRAISTPEWDAKNAIWHFAAIAPLRKKRVANLWERIRNDQ